MSRKLEGYLVVLDFKIRMMPLFLGNLADRIYEFKRMNKILEKPDAGNIFCIRRKFPAFGFFGKTRRFSTSHRLDTFIFARNALFFGEIHSHVVSIPQKATATAGQE